MKTVQNEEYKPDIIKAIALERKSRQKLSCERIAKRMGVTPKMVYYMLTVQHSDDWTIRKTLRLYAALGIPRDALLNAIAEE